MRRCRCTPTASTIHVVDAAGFDAPSTAQAAELLEAHRGGSVLVVLGDDELTAAKSFRNLARVGVLHVDDVGVADLMRRRSSCRRRRSTRSPRARRRSELRSRSTGAAEGGRGGERSETDEAGS